MRRLLTILFLILSFNCFAQLPDKVQHIEIVSELADTMALVNKVDLDKINTTFYLLDISDSLNVVNEQIIDNLKLQNNKLESIIQEQEALITNKDTQLENLKMQNKEIVSNLQKQVNRANTKNIVWEVVSGVLGICLLITI